MFRNLNHLFGWGFFIYIILDFLNIYIIFAYCLTKTLFNMEKIKLNIVGYILKPGSVTLMCDNKFVSGRQYTDNNLNTFIALNETTLVTNGQPNKIKFPTSIVENEIAH